MKKQFIALILVFLIVTMPLTYAQVTGTSDPEFVNQEKEEIPPGEDILVNVASYQPKVVPQQAFETDDYTGYNVYALLTGIQTNPFIDITKIRSISPRIMSSNPKGVQVAYRRPPGPYRLDNLGYMIVKLPRIKDERKIPDKVDVNVVLNILYDIGAGLGVGEIGKNIPQLTEDEFLQDKSKYSFWSGRGYVKADLIEDNKAVFTIYDGRLQKARAGVSLTPGQESGEISLNAGYFFPGYGEEAISRNLRERFKLKLDSISVPRDKAKLEILVNNKFITEELSENQRLYEGSSWKIKKVEANEVQDRVKLFNEETKELSTITGNKIYVFDCTRFNTKELCEEYKDQCDYNDAKKECLPKKDIKPVQLKPNEMAALQGHTLFGPITQEQKDLAESHYKSNQPNDLSTFTPADYVISRYYKITISETGQRHIPGYINSNSIHAEWGVDVGLGSGAEVKPIFNGKITKVSDCSITTSIDSYLDYEIKYSHIVHGFKGEDKDKTINVNYKIANVASEANAKQLGCNIGSGPHLHIGFLKKGNLISLADFEKDTSLFAALTKSTTLLTVSPESEKDLLEAIREYKTLPSDASFEQYETNINKFANIVKNYPNTAEANHAFSYVYGTYAERIYPNNEIKQFVQNYIGKKFLEIGAKAEVPTSTITLQDSNSYYRKALESYKEVAIYKDQVNNDLALKAQRKIAEIYDYYLNEPNNAMQAYSELINNYDISEIEKLDYNSRIEFLRNVNNYRSDLVNLYENGNLIRIRLYGVERTNQKPLAYISINDALAKEFREGDEFKDTTWKIESIESNRITLTSSRFNTFGQNLKEQLYLDQKTSLDNKINVKLIKIDTKREAHVTIKPVLKSLTSVSNLSLHIPIERRLIRLSSEQIDSQVEKTRKLIDSLNNIIEKVERLYKYYLAYCGVVFSILLIKTFASGFGKQFARQQVNEDWEKYCESKGISNCQDEILKNPDLHGKDVSNMKDAVDKSDKIFEKLKEKKGKCEDIDNDFGIDKEFENLATKPLTASYLQDVCSKINLDGEKITNEDDIKDLLLKREKAVFSWSTTGFKDVVEEKNQLEFINKYLSISQSVQTEASVKKLTNNLDKEEFVEGQSKKELLEQGFDNDLYIYLKNRGITEVDWKNKDNREFLVNRYISDKGDEIAQENLRIELLNKKDSYASNFGIESKYIQKKIDDFSLIKALKGPISGPNLENTKTLTSRIDIGANDLGDWKLRNRDAVLVYPIPTKEGEIPRVQTLKDYIEYNFDSSSKDKFTENYDFDYLETKLKEKKAVLVIEEEQGKYKTIDIRKEFVLTVEQKPEIKVDYVGGIKYLKTITAGKGYYVEAKRNSQNIITHFELWDSRGTEDSADDSRVVAETSISQCENILRQKSLGIEACSDLRNYDKQLVEDNKNKIGNKLNKYAVKGFVQKAGLECVKVMDAGDCKWLFAACDPVMCPPSRFNYGNNRVDNVVASGIFGSIFLGLDLWQPYPPEIGICIPGIEAGLKNIRSLLQGYEQCLIVKKEKGENVGICDTIFNIGICKVAWREAYSFINLESGLLGVLINWISPKGVYGGKEYVFFYENLKKTGDFVNFFTNEYATTFFAAFRGSSTQEIGDALCEAAIYGKLPGGGDLIDQLTRPEGPPQFIAILDEIQHTDINLQPTSDYSVFYHIYAGDSYPQIRYYVYLEDVDNIITPPTLAIAPRLGLSAVSTGYLNRGDFVSDTIRLSDKLSGYDQVCVVINNVKKCGFGKVSSDFGVQYLQEKVVKEQLEKKNITSERECAPDSTLVSQFAGAGPLQISAGLGSSILGSGLTSTGIIRKCSAEDPDKGTSIDRWKEVGTCGKDSQGRSLGICWLDKNSYNLLSEDVRKELTKELEEIEKLNEKVKALDLQKDIIIRDIGLLLKEFGSESKENLDNRINKEIENINAVIGDYNEEIIDKSIYAEPSQGAYFSVGELYENLANLLRVKEIKEGPINLGELSTDELQINLVESQVVEFIVNGVKHTLKIIKINDDEIEIEIQSQPQKYKIKLGEKKDDIDLNGDGKNDLVVELKSKNNKNGMVLLNIKAIDESKKQIEKIAITQQTSPEIKQCVIEYEEDNKPIGSIKTGLIRSPLQRANFFYRFNKDQWELKEDKVGYKNVDGEQRYFFKDWTRIDKNTCTNLAFNEYDPIYKKLCSNLVNQNEINGIVSIILLLKQQDDDELFIYPKDSKGQIELEHEEVSFDNVDKVCRGSVTEEQKIILPQKKIALQIRAELLTDFTLAPDINLFWIGNPANYLQKDLIYSWDEEKWADNGAYYNGRINKKNVKSFEDGLEFISQKILELRKTGIIESIKILCMEETKSILSRKEIKEDNFKKLLVESIGKCNLKIEKSASNEVIKSIDYINSNFKGFIQEASSKFGVDENLVEAIIIKESANVGYENAVSPCGAVGLMQLMPGTALEQADKLSSDLKITKIFNNAKHTNCYDDAKEYAKQLSVFSKDKSNLELKEYDDRFDAKKNIFAGISYLSNLLKYYNNQELAIAAYNIGFNKVNELCGNNPINCNRVYVDSVLTNYNIIKDNDVVA